MKTSGGNVTPTVGSTDLRRLDGDKKDAHGLAKRANPTGLSMSGTGRRGRSHPLWVTTCITPLGRRYCAWKDNRQPCYRSNRPLVMVRSTSRGAHRGNDLIEHNVVAVARTMASCWIRARRQVASWSALGTVLLLVSVPTSAQNVVSQDSSTTYRDPVTLADADLQRVIEQAPVRQRAAQQQHLRRLQRKLDNHVGQFVEGFPYQAFQHTLGISNYEVYFNHPDEVFYALSIALPYLSPLLADETKALLKRELKRCPPYSIEGYRNETGTSRTSYAVPEELRIKGSGKAQDAFGIYGLWAYCHYAEDAAEAERTWPEVTKRIAPLLTQSYPFDIYRTDYANDEAEHLNADLAAVIGYLRLARLVGDDTAWKAGWPRCRELLERRINLERVNPAFVHPTHSTTSHLHVFKLPRYVDLVPSVARAVREHAPDASVRLRDYRAERETWYMAFGDRLMGGENYTNPPHFARSLFVGGLFIEQLNAEKQAGFVDVPWCRGDLYFIEKAVGALWSSAGRRWETLDSQDRDVSQDSTNPT